MKRMMLAGIAFIASSSVALAADAGAVVTPGPFSPPPAYGGAAAYPTPAVMPGPFAPPPAYPPVRVYDWTGFYVGINGGGESGSTEWVSLVPIPPAAGTAHFSGGIVGGALGYNLQTGEPYVLGIEADLDWSGGLKATTALAAGCVNLAGTAAPCELQVPWLGTARLRFGYAFDTIMPYLTGGAALANLKAETVGQPLGSVADTNLGWTVGGGIEAAVWDAWRVKVEYLYVNLNGFTCNGPCAGGPIGFDVKSSVVRAGINYRFAPN